MTLLVEDVKKLLDAKQIKYTQVNNELHLQINDLKPSVINNILQLVETTKGKIKMKTSGHEISISC
jgi:hypothetical protein